MSDNMALTKVNELERRFVAATANKSDYTSGYSVEYNLNTDLFGKKYSQHVGTFEPKPNSAVVLIFSTSGENTSGYDLCLRLIVNGTVVCQTRVGEGNWNWSPIKTITSFETTSAVVEFEIEAQNKIGEVQPLSGTLFGFTLGVLGQISTSTPGVLMPFVSADLFGFVYDDDGTLTNKPVVVGVRTLPITKSQLELLLAAGYVLEPDPNATDNDADGDSSAGSGDGNSTDGSGSDTESGTETGDGTESGTDTGDGTESGNGGSGTESGTDTGDGSDTGSDTSNTTSNSNSSLKSKRAQLAYQALALSDAFAEPDIVLAADQKIGYVYSVAGSMFFVEYQKGETPVGKAPIYIGAGNKVKLAYNVVGEPYIATVSGNNLIVRPAQSNSTEIVVAQDVTDFDIFRSDFGLVTVAYIKDGKVYYGEVIDDGPTTIRPLNGITGATGVSFVRGRDTTTALICTTQKGNYLQYLYREPEWSMCFITLQFNTSTLTV